MWEVLDEEADVGAEYAGGENPPGVVHQCGLGAWSRLSPANTQLTINMPLRLVLPPQAAQVLGLWNARTAILDGAGPAERLEVEMVTQGGACLKQLLSNPKVLSEIGTGCYDDVSPPPLSLSLPCVEYAPSTYRQSRNPAAHGSSMRRRRWRRVVITLHTDLSTTISPYIATPYSCRPRFRMEMPLKKLAPPRPHPVRSRDPP